MKMKLSTKYLLHIILSVLFFPIAFLLVNFVYYMTLTYVLNQQDHIYYEADKLESSWQEDIASWRNLSNEDIISHFRETQDYRYSEIAWISDGGEILYASSDKLQLPQAPLNVSEMMRWNEQANQNHLVLNAYVQGSEASGYAYLETPRTIIGSQWEIARDRYAHFWFLGIFFVCALFIFSSWLFFARIQKRLVTLQKHMQKTDEDGIPRNLNVKYEDELGQVEHSFNKMVNELRESKQKESEEAELRRKLIADLSHDLRTPLTVIRGHTFTLSEQPLTDKAKQSVHVINDKVAYVGELIDNLSSFSLLAAGKLPLRMQATDVVKVLRSSLSAWYPVFEQDHFTVEIELEHHVIWEADELWLRRVLDNIFQNVRRHAAQGRYIFVGTIMTNSGVAIQIRDRGPGIHSQSTRKGAGIGMSIIDMMCTQMNLVCTIDSDDEGTTACIQQKSVQAETTLME
jgi:signal transduction histidine kinase